MTNIVTPHITLTDFVDIVAKSGAQKIKKIAQIKHRPEYSPMADFYKKVRAAIVETHVRKLPQTHLGELLPKITDPKKRKHYPDVTSGYTKWWGRKDLRWFAPSTGVFAAHGVEVSVKPELGLYINDEPHLVKLYFKGEALSKDKTEMVTHLMEVTLRTNCLTTAKMAVLDTRKSKLLTPSVPVSHLTAGLHAELAYIRALWDDV